MNVKWLRNRVPVSWWARKCSAGVHCQHEGWHTHHLTNWGRFALGIELKR